MKQLLKSIALAIAFPTAAMAQQSTPIFQSEHFSLYANKIVQEKNEAKAISPLQLNSNYKSPLEGRMSRRISFKFAINGLDNEQGFGIDHHLVLLPKNNKVESIVYIFGEKDSQKAVIPAGVSDVLEPNTELTLRLDMRHVLASFKEKGFYQTHDGSQIAASDFKGVWVAGNAQPLNWDFGQPELQKHLQLQDPDGDGIYQIKLVFNKVEKPLKPLPIPSRTVKADLSKFPQYQSPQLLSDALYNMSLEEMQQNIRADGALMAGAKWEGVWTRDVSYSIILALAIADPEAAKRSLMQKLTADWRIIQDTGTGGSWPISSDRMIWALAAWEIYKVTGDKAWLSQAYSIIQNSVKADLATLANPQTGLFYGESSFMDWREQSYPAWADPRDIYKSQCLSTNIIHYQTYKVLASIAFEKGDTLLNQYNKIADSLQRSINTHLWNPKTGYYGQYLYGRNYLSLSPRSEALGEALAILSGVAPQDKQASIIQNTPVMEYGVPCMYPQVAEQSPYHNDAVWPFVQAYYMWAAADLKQGKAVEHSIASIYRQAALFLTNKENLVASTGDYLGTAINSDRQLWSVAANLSVVYRVFFGLRFNSDQLYFAPIVPKAWAGTRTLKGLKYCKSTLNITVKGFGSKIKTITMDGKSLPRPELDNTLQGTHNIVIELDNTDVPKGSQNIVKPLTSPATPHVLRNGKQIVWAAVPEATEYQVFINGKKVATQTQTSYNLDGDGEYQVLAVAKGADSFLSEPISNYEARNFFVQKYAGGALDIQFKVEKDGIYWLDFFYANGNGPINTDNKCAIRSVLVDGARQGAAVFPQRGSNDWTSKGFSNALPVKLTEGQHTLRLELQLTDANMNESQINEAHIEYLRVSQ
ncbi:hypothetical protein SAMN05421780_103209 [Flexibacter flexilis DSM 6793]|uniref:Mannosylglycerate hydrolase MGH1-like glycoside hydrolase domain-containing protein n=1 Tax=Flexibacter flexilis DSM 6793 TaxID=927664 RepID=A0A1I1HCQ1_9BACT|nr:hypothetical protein [Flexibacter flexilis]SFC18900.1 hypothetical protein SAMN05421780_103209 [Flexibacter flexilis DSM 6793]